MTLFKRIAVFVFLMIIVLIGKAQISDSLYKGLYDDDKPKDRFHVTDKEKLSILSGTYGDKSVHFHNELTEIARQIEQQISTANQKAKVFYSSAVADFFINAGNPQKAFDYYKTTLDYADQNHQFDSIIAHASIYLGGLYALQYKEDSAIHHLQTALSILGSTKDSVTLQAVYNMYQLLYQNLYLYEDAIFYVNKYLTIMPAGQRGLENEASAMMDKASLFITLYNRDKKKIDADSAQILVEKVMQNKNVNHTSWFTGYYYVMGEIQFINSNYKAALALYDSALLPQNIQANASGGSEGLAITKRAICLVKAGNAAEGLKILEGKNIAPHDFAIQKNKYRCLYEYYKSIGNHGKALQYHEDYARYVDSLKINEFKGQVFEAEQKYSVTQKEAAIAVLEKKNLQATVARNKLVLWGVIILLLLALIAALLYMRNKRQQGQRLAERQKLSEQLNQMEEEMELERLRQQKEQLVAISQQRKSISADMHDSIGSDLATLRFFIGDIKRKTSNTEASAAIADIEDEVLSIYQRSRDFMHELNRGDVQEKYNVPDLLQNLELRFNEESSVQVHIDADREKIGSVFTAQQHNEMYRVIREAVANSLKHSGATDIYIRLLAGIRDFFFEIKDNGHGMGRQKENGIGMAAMAERLRSLSGSLTVSDTDSGTSISGSFPLVGAA